MTDRIRRNAPHVARVLLGLIFFVFGLNGFLGFIPQPPIDGPAATFIGGFFSASYMLPLLKGTEVIAGAALLANRFVPLALTVLAPIVLNIVAFHVFLAPTGLGVTFLTLALEIGLAWAYRDSFRGVLAANAKPTVREATAADPRLHAIA